MAHPELSDVERAWLVSIDAMLLQSTPHAHAVTAGRIVELWGAGGVAFREELARRADVWRRRQAQMTMVVSDRAGPCQRLVEMMGRPGDARADPKPKRARPQGPVVRPSRRPRTPARQITDAEAAKFMGLIEDQGISVVFDPGVSMTTSGEVFLPPLIVLDGARVFYEQIAPVYQRGQIERPWDPGEREPAIALAFDLALLVMLKEKKWTWVVCDRYFKRLPWGHPCKITPNGRPGWKLITGLLDQAGLIERRSGQTWRLTRGVQDAIPDLLTPQWTRAAQADQS